MIDPPRLTSSQPDPDLVEALALLGKSDFLLAVHDASFPGVAGEDCGRGSPYGAGGLALAGFARSLGFTGLQLGPQGQTSAVNPSPYDGTLFSRNFHSLDLGALTHDAEWGGLLSEDTWHAAVAGIHVPTGAGWPTLTLSTPMSMRWTRSITVSPRRASRVSPKRCG